MTTAIVTLLGIGVSPGFSMWTVVCIGLAAIVAGFTLGAVLFAPSMPRVPLAKLRPGESDPRD